MNETHVRALIAAGRLLQSDNWPGGRMKIGKREGESYPQAVTRAIAALEEADRHRLRELVTWVLAYEQSECRMDKNIRVTNGDSGKGAARDPCARSNSSDHLSRSRC